MNYLSEIIKDQQKINHQLSDSFNKMGQTLQDTKFEQTKHFDHVYSQLDKHESFAQQFVENIKEQGSASSQILERLEKLEALNTNLIKNIESEGLINQAILDQLSFQDNSSKEIVHKMNEYESVAEELKAQLQKHDELYKQVAEKLELQEMFHKTIMERMEQQDAISEKIVRQVENLRSIIFERASTLLDKIDENYNKSKSFIQSLFTKQGNKQKYLINRYEKDSLEAEKKEA